MTLKHLPSLLVCALVALLFETLTGGSAQAEWVILTSGEKFETDRSWHENGRRKFRLNGLVVSVPESDVAKLIGPAPTPADAPDTAMAAPSAPGPQRVTATAAEGRQSSRSARLQNALRLPPPGSVPLGQPPSLTAARPQRSSAAAEHRDAQVMEGEPATAPSTTSAPTSGPPHRGVFRDLAWGVRPSSMPGLLLSQTNPAYGGVDEFFYPQEDLRLGDAPLNGILYGFWQNRLYTITIWADGPPSYKKLRRWVLDTYGPGHQSDRSVERRVWYGNGTDMLLEFDETLNTGIFWMRSAKLHTRVREMSSP